MNDEGKECVMNKRNARQREGMCDKTLRVSMWEAYVYWSF